MSSHLLKVGSSSLTFLHDLETRNLENTDDPI